MPIEGSINEASEVYSPDSLTNDLRSSRETSLNYAKKELEIKKGDIFYENMYKRQIEFLSKASDTAYFLSFQNSFLGHFPGGFKRREWDEKLLDPRAVVDIQNDPERKKQSDKAKKLHNTFDEVIEKLGYDFGSLEEWNLRNYSTRFFELETKNNLNEEEENELKLMTGHIKLIQNVYIEMRKLGYTEFELLG